MCINAISDKTAHVKMLAWKLWSKNEDDAEFEKLVAAISSLEDAVREVKYAPRNALIETIPSEVSHDLR